MAALHPAEDFLVAYASGSLDEPTSLLVATHLALCPGCRHAVGAYEALGGVLLQGLPPVSVEPDSLDGLLQRLDADPAAEPAAEPDPSAIPESEPAARDGRLPEPLRSYVAGALGRLRWRWLMPGLRAADLGVGRPPVRTRLIRARAGLSVPRHTHAGTELTLVLAGGFLDEYGHCRRGDVRLSDATVTHRQVIDRDEDCICLVVTDAPLRLTGALGRIVGWIRPI